MRRELQRRQVVAHHQRRQRLPRGRIALRQFAVDGAFTPPVLLAAGALIQSLIERREKLAVRGYKRWKRFNRTGIMRDALTEIMRSARAQP